jgi:hypothetical protein
VVICAAGGALGGLDVVGWSALVDAVAGSSQVLVPRASDIAHQAVTSSLAWSMLLASLSGRLGPLRGLA